MDTALTDRSPDRVDAEKISACLTAILSSDEMADAPRLQDFLRYVVEEKLAGREDLIVGKAITQSVYGRDIGKGHENDTNVRVDAGRLRKKLEAYYADQGRGDIYRIDIPVGGYKPVFVKQTRPLSGHWTRTHQVLLVVGLAVAGLTAALWLTRTDGSQAPTSSAAAPADPSHRNTRLELERQAMFDKSPGSLEAYELTQQARSLIFPPLDPVRRKSALDLFERAIVLDDNYYGPYAGAAQVLAFTAFVSPPPEASAALDRAQSMVNKARVIDPTRPWVQSALAWVAYVSGNHDEALVYSDRAAAMAPDDWLIIDMHSVILMLNGDFEKALEIAKRNQGNRDPTSSVRRNVVAVSNFHLGRYRETIDTINALNATGATSSPLTATYLIAALQADGQSEAASRLNAATQDTWPDFKAPVLVRRIFRNPEDAEKVVAQLNAAGWLE